MSGSLSFCRQFANRVSNLLCEHINEVRMVVEDSQFVDMDPGGFWLLQCGGDVFTILAAAGIAAEPRGYKGDRSFDSVAFHLHQSVIKEWLPVAIAPIDWQ